ncbi:MAG: hypothetical protein H6R38_286 [Deltaproteobacteria bacterium]|nr:hypothetical protein [Deltaproteobacteria bacterium]
MEETPRVAPLKRVGLAVEAGAAATDPCAMCTEVAFIFGIGSAGVLPFECLLAGKRVGDTISFQAAKAGAEDFFGHLTAQFLGFFDRHREVFFHTRVIRVDTPEPREVVKAIAEMTAHGHGGGCDCGCGCG